MEAGGTRRLYATASEMEKSKMVRKRLAATRKRKLEELKERKAKPKEISIPSRATPKNLSAVTGLSTIDILKVAIKCGHEPRTVDDVLPPELVDILCEELYFVPRRSDLNEGTGMKLTRTIDEADMVPRPPIVAVMGHVNHGKTSLLDALRKTSVVDVEEGRITQRLSASMVQLSSGQKITFMDTPGHNAFAAMRQRGAAMTDMVILVVAADEGVMQQTEEAIEVTREANVPLLVAINKIEKEGANPSKVKRQLLQHGVILEEFGGDVQCVELSASTGKNLDELTDAILLQAEMLDLRADPNGPAESVVIESKIDKGRGVVGTVLVRQGQLKLNNFFVAGGTWGRVRGLTDWLGRSTTKADPSTPVEVIGFKTKILPDPGDDLVVVLGEEQAKQILDYRKERLHAKEALTDVVQASDPAARAAAAKQEMEKALNVVIKADIGGTLQAVESTISQFPQDEVKLRIIKSAVGDISTTDIGLAKDTGAVVFGFNVPPMNSVLELARVEKVDINNYSIIYQLADDIKKRLESMLAPREVEEEVGRGDVLSVFSVTMPNREQHNVAGLRVVRGALDSRLRVRLLRRNKDVNADEEYAALYDGPIESLKKFKDDVTLAKKGDECGLALPKWNDLRPGDIISCYRMKQVPRKFGDPK